MIDEALRWSTADGDGHGRLYLPDGPGPWPLVLLLMDAFGPRPALRGIAERLVGGGYAVALPDLYWRSGPYAPFHAATTFHDPPERARIRALMDAFTPAQVAADADAILALLGGDTRVRAEPVRLLGYCMGGRQALLLAAHLGPRAAAMACIHGGGLVRPDPSSPHLGAPRIRARCYVAVADRDPSCTAADAATLEAALAAAGVDHRVEPYPGALHGFAAPDMTVYDPAAAERHWARVFELFGAVG